MVKKSYHYKNRICPVCNKTVGSYFYTINDDGKKVHSECVDR